MWCTIDTGHRGVKLLLVSSPVGSLVRAPRSPYLKGGCDREGACGQRENTETERSESQRGNEMSEAREETGVDECDHWWY